MRRKPIVSLIGRVGILLAICALSGHDAYGRHLQPEEALSMIPSGPLKSVSSAPLRLAYTQKSASDVSTVYVFDRDGKPGFYVLAADDAVGDIVLGYSHTSYFSAEDMAPGMKWLLEAYSGKVCSCAAGASAPRMEVPPVLPKVEPLLTTKWDQDAPYNGMCPVLLGSPTVTGCMATAAAQVMKKHQWPVTGTGTHSYKPPYTVNGVQPTFSSDFASHTYDWDNMLDEYENGGYTKTQADAVAQLMYDCGVAADMEYGFKESSASLFDEGRGLLAYFDYDKSMQFLKREWFSDRDWNMLMHSQVDAGWPVLYSGQGPGGGHAFVLDGYDGEGYFHINWGWSGRSDGYYSLDNLSPASTGIGGGMGPYNMDQQAIVGIRPNVGHPLYVNFELSDDFSTDRSTYAASNDPVYFNLKFFSYTLQKANVEIGLANTKNNDVLAVTTREFDSTSDHIQGVGLQKGYYSQSFPDGEYDVYPVVRCEGGEWTRMNRAFGETVGQLHFSKNATSLTVADVKEFTPQITSTFLSSTPDDAADEGYCPGHSYTVTYRFKVSKPCTASITLLIQNSESAVLSESDPVQTAFGAGEYEKSFHITIPGNVTAGEYYLGMKCEDEDGVIMWSPNKIIEVKEVPTVVDATGIVLNTESVGLTEGDSYQLTATVSPENTTDKTVTWSTSDASIATVDAEGTVTAISEGTAKITATCGAVSANCAVTVAKRIIAATGIALNTEAIELIEGDSFRLIASVSPEDTTDKTVTWSTSDPAVATVDAEGNVTAISEGTATITATCGEVSAVCTVTVAKRIIAATGIALNTEAMELIEGDIFQLIASVSPEDATDKTVTWVTSDASIATVDVEGIVTAISEGTATITAICGEVSATCTVTVTKRIIPATGITLNTESIELIEGDIFQLIASVSPEDATDKTVTWISSDASIATVDAEGTVTAISEGTATITAICGEVSATCTVTVTKRIIPATGITLNTESIELIEGDIFQLIAIVSPEDATYKTVTWVTSDASIATVDAEGTVTAISEGTVTITATCGEASATCTVTVTKRIIAATGIALNTESIELIEGDIFRLIAIVSPEDATDKTVTWITSDASIATVDVEGTVTAISEGTATITAICGEVSATCEVTVKPLNGIWDIVAEGIAIRVEGGYLYIEASEDARIALYDIAGRLYYNGYDHTIPVENNKIYIVVIGTSTFKVKA